MNKDKCKYCGKEFYKKYGKIIYEIRKETNTYCSITCFAKDRIDMMKEIMRNI